MADINDFKSILISYLPYCGIKQMTMLRDNADIQSLINRNEFNALIIRELKRRAKLNNAIYYQYSR
jgi:hypothetical protein